MWNIWKYSEKDRIFFDGSKTTENLLIKKRRHNLTEWGKRLIDTFGDGEGVSTAYVIVILISACDLLLCFRT